MTSSSACPPTNTPAPNLPPPKPEISSPSAHLPKEERLSRLERSQSVGTWWQSVHLPKEERLSLKRQIEQLFSVGHSFIAYPIRIVYRPLTSDEPPVTAILVSVSKRRFKRAVDRNRIRRLLREVYRLNKGWLTFGKNTVNLPAPKDIASPTLPLATAMDIPSDVPPSDSPFPDTLNSEEAKSCLYRINRNSDSPFPETLNSEEAKSCLHRINRNSDSPFPKTLNSELSSEAMASISSLPPPCAFHIAFIYVGNALPTFSQLQKSMQRALLSIHKNSR
jgi:ribonuclease P protein component